MKFQGDPREFLHPDPLSLDVLTAALVAAIRHADDPPAALKEVRRRLSRHARRGDLAPRLRVRHNDDRDQIEVDWRDP